MSCRIIILDDNLEGEYEKFILEFDKTMIYASSKYKKLLREFLAADDVYFVAIGAGGEIVGVLPTFLKRDNIVGNIINSLPFYGSNGGVITHDQTGMVTKELLDSFYEFAVQHKCISSTIIVSPFEKDLSQYEDKNRYTYRDSRIGQITLLPAMTADVSDVVMNTIHSKTRNMVRKAEKSGVVVQRDLTPSNLDFLVKTHHENMAEIGGIAKPDKFFSLIPDCFEYGKDYCIYSANLDGVPIAAVLLFFFNKTVEYFTPVIVKEYRSTQPLSLIIFKAMCESVINGFENWNWGGTWLSQGGVYDFKKRWGTRDLPYFYYTKIFDNKLLKLSKQDFLEKYPFFYVIPFSEIKE